MKPAQGRRGDRGQRRRRTTPICSVATENGYGKRTRIDELPGQGSRTVGVKTVQLIEAKGQLAGARVVRDGYQVMLISDRRHGDPHARRGASGGSAARRRA